MPKLAPRGDGAHSHGHAKLLQPLLFQLFGLEEELEAALALFVREVESVGPLQQNNTASGGGEAAPRRINKPRARVSWRRGYGETDGDKEMQNERGLPGGEPTKSGGMEGGRTDRQTENRERDEGCEVAAPRNELLIYLSQAEG